MEICGLIIVGNLIGPLLTALLVFFISIVGFYVTRREGYQTYRLAIIQLKNGQIPGQALLDGLLILIAGLLLIVPGFLTDLLGFILVIPYTRKFLKFFLLLWIQRRISKGQFVGYRR